MAIKERSSETTPDTQGARSSNDILRIISLVLGDILVFMIFAMVGRGSHGEETGLTAISKIAVTAFPFMLGWFIVSPFIGAFRRDIMADPRKMVKRTLLAWVCAWPVCMLLRGFFVDHTIPPFSFWIVTLIANAVFLSIWRVPFALTHKGKMPREVQR